LSTDESEAMWSRRNEVREEKGIEKLGKNTVLSMWDR
jgi:hypothetical protein